MNFSFIFAVQSIELSSDSEVEDSSEEVIVNSDTGKTVQAKDVIVSIVMHNSPIAIHI